MPQQHKITEQPQERSEDILADVVATFKALSDATRAQMVYLLTEKEYGVNGLSEGVAVSPSAVFHHLAKLRAIRLVRTRREGNQIFYSIDDSHIAARFRKAPYHLDQVRQNLPDHPHPDYLNNLPDK